MGKNTAIKVINQCQECGLKSKKLQCKMKFTEATQNANTRRRSLLLNNRITGVTNTTRWIANPLLTDDLEHTNISKALAL